MVNCLALDHPRFRRVQRDIFTSRVVTECMTHSCKLVKSGGATFHDACCQYGVDVDLGERDGILEHAAEISALLDPPAREAAWFVGDEIEDADFASGRYVRTNRVGEGCLFLAHDARGCAIHRAAIEGEWSMSGIKPHVCRLFPLTYTGDLICLSDDYSDYSCAYEPSAPTIYRAARRDLGEFFGEALIAALDRCEDSVASKASTPTRLPLASI